MVLHLSGQHGGEDQAGDDDAEQSVRVKDTPPAAIPGRNEDQADRESQHQQVALDGEIAQQAHETDSKPDSSLARRRIHVGPAIGEQHDLRDQGCREHHRQHSVPGTAGNPPAHHSGMRRSTWSPHVAHTVTHTPERCPDMPVELHKRRHPQRRGTRVVKRRPNRGGGRRTAASFPSRTWGFPRACRSWRAASSRPTPARRTAPGPGPAAPGRRPTGAGTAREW